MASLTKSEELELLLLLEKEFREKVSKKIEEFRKPARFKVAYGGRGAGAKTRGSISLIVQRANREHTEIICLREIFNTLAESIHKKISDMIDRLQYSDWIVTDEKIRNVRNGSYFIFRGLKDLRAAKNIKGLDDFDIAIIDEASAVSYDSWIYLTPTMRKKGSEIWALFNRDEELDPVYELFCLKPSKNSIILEMEPGPIDNPWWYDSELQTDWDWWKERDLDEWEHIYLGQPRKQGINSALKRTSIRGAMNREIDPVGAIEIGVDVARFGSDKTVIYKRHGLKIIDKKSWVGQDTMRTAKEAWAMADYKPYVLIKVDDTGVGGGVTDRLRELGAKVIPICFNGLPNQIDKYTSIADEMWFEFPIDECDIPCDNELMKQLSGRRYDFDNKGRRKIESKSDFKKRLGYSPDDADALLLCFYQGGHMNMSNELRQQMADRRNKH